MNLLKMGISIDQSWRFAVNWIMVFALFFPGIAATAQSAKKAGTSDWFGPLAGVNVVLFYPKDVNENPIVGGDPEILPGAMFGLSYYHAFTPRWAQLFQLRVADRQIKYWKSTRQIWYSMGQQATVKSDSGDYHIKYKVVSMNYMFGWCLNKQVGWHIYTGVLVNHTIDNQSTKVIDRTEFGSVTANKFIPYTEPIIYESEKSVTYAPDGNIEFMLRTDLKINLGDQWMIRPVVEYGFEPSHIHVSVKEKLSFYLEIYKAI